MVMVECASMLNFGTQVSLEILLATFRIIKVSVEAQSASTAI